MLVASADSFNVHQRHVPDAPLNSAVVGPVQPAALGSLFLIDPLLFANAPDGAAKADSDVERHRMSCSRHAADA